MKIKNRIHKLLVVALVMAMVTGVWAPRARAEEAPETFYGRIRVLDVDTSSVVTCDAARSAEGVVYIAAQDFAEIAGAELTISANTMLTFSLGLRTVSVNAENQIGQVHYDLKGSGENLGFQLYGDFTLEELLPYEEENSWYVPFEQLLYMCGMEWGCQDGVVIPYRPETLFEIVAESDRMMADNPDYSDVMGDGRLEQWGNSFKYGFQAAIDDIDMTFIWDSIATSLHIKDTMTYEDNVLEAALLMLRTDAPEAEPDAIDDSMTLTSPTDFMGAMATAFDLGSEGMGAQVASQLIGDFLGVSVSSETMKVISPSVGAGVPFISYLLNVEQALWAREYMPQSLQQRLQRIQTETQGAESGFAKQLSSAAASVEEKYYDDIANVYLQELSLDSLATMVDNIMKLVDFNVGSTDLAVVPLRWAATTVGVFDLGVELIKGSVPAVAEALEKAENVNTSLALVRTSAVMKAAYEEAVLNLRDNRESLDAERLQAVRECAGIMECMAMHAQETLAEAGLGSAEGVSAHAGYLQRLNESSKYDGLLLLSTDFSGMYSEEAGCLRQAIPPEYVFGLPVIDMDLSPNMAQAEALTEDGEPLEEGLPQVTIDTTQTAEYGMGSLVLSMEPYGSITIESQLMSTYGTLMGVDMGDGEYTFGLVVYAMGTMGGCEAWIIRPVDGTLQVVKTFTLQERSDSISVTGTFGSASELSGTLEPTKTPFSVTLTTELEERTGKTVSENGLGTLGYEANEDGFYDFVFSTINRGIFNMDVVGFGRTRYVLEDGQVVIGEQWFEVN